MVRNFFHIPISDSSSSKKIPDASYPLLTMQRERREREKKKHRIRGSKMPLVLMFRLQEYHHYAYGRKEERQAAAEGKKSLKEAQTTFRRGRSQEMSPDSSKTKAAKVSTRMKMKTQPTFFLFCFTLQKKIVTDTFRTVPR